MILRSVVHVLQMFLKSNMYISQKDKWTLHRMKCNKAEHGCKSTIQMYMALLQGIVPSFGSTPRKENIPLVTTMLITSVHVRFPGYKYLLYNMSDLHGV